MSDIGNRQVMSHNILKYMEINGKTRRDVSEATGIAYSTLCDWINCNKYPRIDNIQRMAEYFGIDKSALIEANSSFAYTTASNITPMPATYKVPRLGRIACGDPILAEENIEDFDDVPAYINCDFTLICRGDSMINARIFDGDIVCIKTDVEINTGDIAAVLVDEDEATLKRVRLFSDHIILEAENPTFPNKSFWEDDMNRVRIIGKATHFISVVK